VKFAFISAEKAWAPVSVLCRILGVTRSGFYAWEERGPSEQAVDDQKLALEIAAIHKASGETYGSPRVHAELRAKGLEVSRKRVARLMRELGIKSLRKRRFRATTDSGHNLPVADNVLDRKFEVDAPDVAWVTDITYVWTDEGWLYLAAILDLFSRRVVGLATSERIDRALVIEALRVAVGRRTVPDSGLVHHSDRGSQYASGDYQNALHNLGVVCSMSRKGNCWDNAVAESFFATLKTECIYPRRFATRQEAREEIFRFIEVFYNGRRRHSTLGYVSPMEFEKKFLEGTKKRDYERQTAA
jgi:putative transposase